MTPEQKRLSIVCDGLRLAGGAYVPDEARGVVVLLHGIPSTAPPDPDDEGYPGLARRFAQEGWAAAWVEMRGVRASQGHFSIEGWVRDARAAIDSARTLDGAQGLPLALVGSSAGGCVSVEAIKRGAPVDAVALLAAPAAWVSFAGDPAAAVSRITEEAGMPLSEETLADPTAWAAEFETVVTEASIVDVKVPTLVVHGTDDDVVPVDHASRIADRARKAELVILDGGAHQLRRDDRAVKTVLEWLNRVFS
ncbi:MAG: alpha/beta hydrolase [Actinomycetota bacterium]|nr:alpha/beta hydrolase [Actinomycetota bacterium]